MHPVTWRERLRYAFDNTLSRGPIALIGWLFAASAVMIGIVSLVVVLAGAAPQAEDGRPLSFLAVTWMSLLRTLDSGTMGGDVGSPFFLTAMLLITFGGIFVVSTLIGILTSGLEARLDALRKSRSLVVEKDHTVILGWSPQVISILGELAMANANRRRPAVAILADRDKVEMEDEIRAKLGGKLGTTRVVCRSGSPMDLADLEVVRPHSARAIIVVSPEVDDPDPQVIKTVLAITNNPKRRAEPYHIVAEIRDPRNLPVARMVGRDELEIVLASEVISRLAVQTCRQSGLSVVYNELLDFGGDEIYFAPCPELAGRTFGEALHAYRTSAVIGLRRADGSILLGPAMDTTIAAGDRVIAISEDDDTIRVESASPTPWDETAIRSAGEGPERPERTLILGWHERTSAMLDELEQYVAPGSETVVVAPAGAAADLAGQSGSRWPKQQVRGLEGDTTDRDLLESLGIERFDHVMVLASTHGDGAQASDARTLVTLLHLRDMAERGGHDFAIVSEMLDERNRELAEVTQADDFIVSDRLVGLLMTQIAENKELAALFADILDADGSEIYLKPASDYVATDREVTFYTVIEAARRRGEVAIGYRLHRHSGDASKAYGVRVNPDKGHSVRFDPGDRIVVIAEE